MELSSGWPLSSLPQRIPLHGIWRLGPRISLLFIQIIWCVPGIWHKVHELLPDHRILLWKWRFCQKKLQPPWYARINLWSQGHTRMCCLSTQRSRNEVRWVHQALTLAYFGFCFRNPDGDQKPWCFIKVNSAKVKWEYCDVPACSALGKTWLSRGPGGGGDTHP